MIGSPPGIARGTKEKGGLDELLFYMSQDFFDFG